MLLSFEQSDHRLLAKTRSQLIRSIEATGHLTVHGSHDRDAKGRARSPKP